MPVVTINAEFLIGAFSFVVGILILVIGAYLALLKRSIFNKIESCSEVIQSEVKHIKEHSVETRKIANHAHDRLSEYISK